MNYFASRRQVFHSKRNILVLLKSVISWLGCRAVLASKPILGKSPTQIRPPWKI